MTMPKIYNFSVSFIKLSLILALLVNLVACGIYQPGVDTRKRPVKGTDRARQNLEQGKGFKLSELGGNKKTTYEFSTSNPMWRSSLEVLDFLPLTTVDYSGGMIISDWYNDTANNNDSIKITIRFLSNEVKTNSLKVIVHKKTCKSTNNCVVKKIDSKIEEELKRSILKKAARLEADAKNKKKN